MKSRAQRYRYVRHVVSGTRPSPWSPLSLGSSLAAWYKADAGCYTDAACLFASASSQYLSKTSPTFAPTNKMTIAFDWKPTSVGALQVLVARWGGGDNQFFVSMTSGGQIQVFVADSAGDAGSNNFLVSSSLADDVNARIVVVYDGTLAAANRVTVYVNGSAEAGVVSGTIPAALTVSARPLEIGGLSASATADGAIARLGFSSQALSGAALTAAHTSTFWADMTAARQADWFSFYNLCEASGTRVDSTGLNNLTPTNGPTVAAGPGEGLCVNNSPCKRVTDYSGNSRNLLQATVSAQPIWLASGQNGLPVLRFTSANSTTIKATYTLAQPADVFAAFAWTGQDYALDGGSLHAMALLTNGADAQMYAGSFGPALTSPSTAFHVFRMLFSGASSVFSIDSGADATGNPGTATTAGLTVGSSGTPGNYSSLDFGELFIASAAVAAATTPKTYLKSRWATP